MSQTSPGFTADDLLSVLGGVQASSEDGSWMTIREAWGGRSFDVDIDGAVAYLNDEFYPKSRQPGQKAIKDALSYFDLEIQEFTGTTPPEGDPIILDRDGPRLTHEVRENLTSREWFARAEVESHPSQGDR